MTPALLADVAAAISAAEGGTFSCARPAPASGGCINRGYTLVGEEGRRFFVKVNEAASGDMFTAEADGLHEVLNTGAIRAPRPICVGRSGREAFLVLEWLHLNGRPQPEALGRGLAKLHRQTQGAFGWRRDNTIGSTPQQNQPEADWVAFYLHRRLRPQLVLAQNNHAPGGLLKSGERLAADLTGFFVSYLPTPSLVHGDLWGGNYGYSDYGPVLFDPAVYYADREVDLAMSELFGGFPPQFYAAYQEAWPLDSGYAVRKRLYNLYHVLNHFNLFGGGYAAQAQAMMASLLSELR